MELQNPNDFTANESAEVRTVSDDTQHWDDPVQVENAGDDYTGFLPREDTPAEMSDSLHWEEDPVETLLRQIHGEVSAARIAAEATAANTATLLALFGEVVTVVNALGEKADGLFGGDSAPKLGGPAGMILSALLPKR
jgi:hypothetical protein